MGQTNGKFEITNNSILLLALLDYLSL